MAITIIPTTNIPLPDDFESEEPKSFDQKVKVAAATAKVLVDAGAEIPVSTQEKKEESLERAENKNQSFGIRIYNEPFSLEHSSKEETR